MIKYIKRRKMFTNSLVCFNMTWCQQAISSTDKNNWSNAITTVRGRSNTSISLMMSRGPIISESYLTCALLVAKATEAYIIPFSLIRLDSILWTQEAHVIPQTWKKVKRSTSRERSRNILKRVWSEEPVWFLSSAEKKVAMYSTSSSDTDG